MLDDQDELLKSLRDGYNAPPETPREEMWEAIEARLGSSEPGVISLEDARSRQRPQGRPRPRGLVGWAAAAAAVLVVGVGIGRVTAPVPVPVPEVATRQPANQAVLRAAAVEHLVRTESLLTLVRADARAGRLEPALATWSRTLLSQTRLLMDAETGADPAMTELLEDLELVLIQIVGAANAPEADSARVREEMTLALNGLNEREVLTRIQAVIPAGAGYPRDLKGT